MSWEFSELRKLKKRKRQLTRPYRVGFLKLQQAWQAEGTWPRPGGGQCLPVVKTQACPGVRGACGYRLHAHPGNGLLKTSRAFPHVAHLSQMEEELLLRAGVGVGESGEQALLGPLCGFSVLAERPELVFLLAHDPRPTAQPFVWF